MKETKIWLLQKCLLAGRHHSRRERESHNVSGEYLHVLIQRCKRHLGVLWLVQRTFSFPDNTISFCVQTGEKTVISINIYPTEEARANADKIHDENAATKGFWETLHDIVPISGKVMVTYLNGKQVEEWQMRSVFTAVIRRFWAVCKQPLVTLRSFSVSLYGNNRQC